MLSASLSVRAPPNDLLLPLSATVSCSTSISRASLSAFFSSPSNFAADDGDDDSASLSFFLTPSSGSTGRDVASGSAAWISASDCETLSEPVSGSVGNM